MGWGGGLCGKGVGHLAGAGPSHGAWKALASPAQIMQGAEGCGPLTASLAPKHMILASLNLLLRQAAPVMLLLHSICAGWPLTMLRWTSFIPRCSVLQASLADGATSLHAIPLSDPAECPQCLHPAAPRASTPLWLLKPTAPPGSPS